MRKKILRSFGLAFANIRSRFFHTLLSILGIVIGVAALVAILSLIDGMEKYAKDQISETTSLEAILIRSQTSKQVNGMRLAKDDFPIIDYALARQIHKQLSAPSELFIRSSKTSEVYTADRTDSLVAIIVGSDERIVSDLKLLTGRGLSVQDLRDSAKVMVVNQYFAEELAKGKEVERLLHTQLHTNGNEFEIIGVMEEENTKVARAFTPISLYGPTYLKQHPPMCIIRASTVEDVPRLKKEAENALHAHFGVASKEFTIATNEMRVRQAAQGFLLFRIVMGLIVGISVLVGGIGVMNVLLISVRERTSEIGISKALGANKKDILYQFLAESITISSLGSMLGLVVGILGTFACIPIIKAFADVPFQAHFTIQTLFVVSIVAVLVGIVFGTYPARKAAKLDPVEAIRRV